MKIKYDMSKNYWNTHNEAQAIVMMRKKLLRNKNARIGNIFRSGIFYGIGILIVSIFYFVCKKIGVEELFLNVISDLFSYIAITLQCTQYYQSVHSAAMSILEQNKAS